LLRLGVLLCGMSLHAARAVHAHDPPQIEQLALAADASWVLRSNRGFLLGERASPSLNCKINQSAPMGVISGTFEHNVANGIGRLYIQVVAE
jgi:hypothetical protein